MKTAVLVLCASITACALRRGPPAAPPATAPPPAAEAGTWAALPKDLQPEQVKLLQRALAARGFAVEPSGRVDDATRVALKDFQRSRGLAETGDLNPDTAEALELDPEAVMPVRGSSAPAGLPREGAAQEGARPDAAAAPAGGAPR